MPPQLAHQMAHLLSQRRQNSTFRTLSTFPPTNVDFSSNDFLSLSTSPLLRTPFLSLLTTTPPSHFRIGSTGSRLLDGNTHFAENLEKEIAEFHGAEASLVFGSGFDANEGFFACVPQKGDVVVWDEGVHASVREGVRLCRMGRGIGFAHNDISSLRAVLEGIREEDRELERLGSGEGRKRNVFVAVESLYSMDGDLAPLREIVELVEEMFGRLDHGGRGLVVVDEAHSTGLYGRNGRGVVSELGLEGRVFARLHTFGKALGCNGAAILCSSLTRDYLINYARPLIYTTAMSYPSLAAISCVYTLMREGKTESLRAHLSTLIQHLYTRLLTLTPLLHPSTSSQPLLNIPPQLPRSPIFSIEMPNPRSLARYCQERGFTVRAIMPPTVKEGTQRVRVCLHAGNTREEVEGLVGCLRGWLVEQGAGERGGRIEEERESEGDGEGMVVKAML